MAYDEYLAERIQQVLDAKKVMYITKKMMGGLCYMVEDKMCIGIMGVKPDKPSQIMARIGPEAYPEVLKKEGCHEMTFTGRSMKGFVFVDEEALDTEDQLELWIDLCIAYNPIATSSKKRR